MAASPGAAAAAEVVELCSELIRFDTSNYGSDEGPGERAAAEYVAGKLGDAGLSPELFEPARGRASVVARVPGLDPGRPALLLHSHLDVVPAEPSDWSVHPFSGEVAGGMVWGRGAVDMKGMVAMILAVTRARAAAGRLPSRDLVLAFVADEEAGGAKGARYLVDHRRDLLEGCTEAIGEVGGFSVTIGNRRLYLVETAQKGISWELVTARGTAGHGSMINSDNPVTALAAAIARIGEHSFPARLIPATQAFLEECAAAMGMHLDLDDPDAVARELGPIARMISATLRNTANPTQLMAGYKVNVVPQKAEARIDARFLPGMEAELDADLDALLGPGIERRIEKRDVAVVTSFDGALVDAMVAALAAFDPDGRAVPYCMSGGTDAKSFSRAGVRCFGFAPLKLPAGLDFSGLFHGIDERVPVDALTFGARVLDYFLDSC